MTCVGSVDCNSEDWGSGNFRVYGSGNTKIGCPESWALIAGFTGDLMKVSREEDISRGSRSKLCRNRFDANWCWCLSKNVGSYFDKRFGLKLCRSSDCQFFWCNGWCFNSCVRRKLRNNWTLRWHFLFKKFLLSFFYAYLLPSSNKIMGHDLQ